jgi:hypothetical protein
MKISMNDKELFTLNETQKKVLMDEICCHDLESDIARRIEWVVMHKYNEIFKRLKSEWEPKLKAAGIRSFPADPDEFAELVLKQKGYQNRSLRNKNSSKEKQSLDNQSDIK